MLQALVFALSSRRTLSVVLLSFASGLPLGLIYYSIPVWMTQAGIDIRIVGLITLAHAPWTFKMLWSPWMDRFAPPRLPRRRGWIGLMQVALIALTLLLAGVGAAPDAPWIVLSVALAIAFASASQDIVIDAYAVEVLRPEEHGVAVGARTAVYRGAMFVAGGLMITITTWVSWSTASMLLALCYLPMLLVTAMAPEPEVAAPPPRTLRDAIWLPLVGLLGRPRALEILAFVILYKLADNLADSLVGPFLVQRGYDAIDVGVAMKTIGLIGILAGNFLGGALTTTLGLGHCLWLFGVVQIFSNLGYVLVAQSDINRPLMFGAMGFEAFAKGLGMGAFGVLLLRLTEKRFSATQYALLSSLFAISRVVAGPVTGFTVHALGWTTFYWLTMVAGLPGLWMLARFVPPGVREPDLQRAATCAPAAVRGPSVRRALAGGVAGLILALAVLATLAALADPGRGFPFVAELAALLAPEDLSGWLRLFGAAVFAVVCGLISAARGMAEGGRGGQSPPSIGA